MPKFSANLSMLFNEHNFLDRFDSASKAGFSGIEYVSPYQFSAQEIKQRLDDNGLQQILFNLPLGDWAKGERGITCHPGRVNEYQEGVDKAIEYAIALDCSQCNTLAGIIPSDVSDQQARETFVSNLSYAADKFATAKLTLLTEAINTYDMPGFFLNNTTQAMSIIDQVKKSNLYYQYDIYHMQRMEGELASTIETNLSRIGHFQLADNPGRHEPGSGEINYRFLLGFIDKLGYDGWIGAEYIPKTTTLEGLNWMSKYQK
ncbi:MAG: hydroxypyruvate isomerase [Oceanicoccus sp.]